MGRKSKRVIVRILAVLMAFTLLPFDLLGSAKVVMAEELSEVYTEEATGEETDFEVVEDVADTQEDVGAAENVTDTQEEKTDHALTEEVTDQKEFSSDAALTEEIMDTESVEEDSALTSEVETSEEIKKVEVKEEEKPSAETVNKATVEHIHNFTDADGKYNGTSDDYFKIEGSEKSGVKEFTYQDLTLKKALKMDSAGKVSFKASAGSVLELLVYIPATGQLKIDGVDGKAGTDIANALTVIDETNLIYRLEMTLGAGTNGEHTVERASKELQLFYIAVTEEEKEKVSTPVANPAPVDGDINVGDKITLSCEPADAIIYYTIDGSEPKNNASKKEYANGITIDTEEGSITIKAYAEKQGYNDSDTVSFTYTVSATPSENQLERPIAEPDSGEVARGTEVTLKKGNDDIENVSIYYTLDGTVPTKSSTLFEQPILINKPTIIKAIAVAEGKDTSFVATFTYTIKQSVISVDEGSDTIISNVEKDGDVTFINQDDKEVFDVRLKAQENASPADEIKAKAENLKEDGGTILYYDFSLANAEAENDTVTISKDSTGTLSIKMPYTIASGAGKRNKIIVLHNTDEIEVEKEPDGFSFSADSFSPYTVIVNPASKIQDISITKSAGYEEGAYAEWEAVEGADGYMAYVASAGGEFTRIDDELIREYKDYWRVDTVGLAKGTYYIKVNAVMLDTQDGQTTATVIATNMTKALHVVRHDRSGYAWVDGTSSGAYNENGTLKSNANVIYVTEETKDTVSLDVVISNKGAVTSCEGVIAILAGYKKGYDKTPLAIRIIGNITDFEGIDANKDCKGDIAVDSTTGGVTIEGIGEDAVANGWGIRLKNASNVEIRNLAFMNCNSDEGDNVGLQQNNNHIWVHHCDMFYGDAGSDADQVKGDGALDCKESTNVTFSYNHFWDSGKCNLAGLSSETTDMCITYHHNWYDHSDSRHPRIRFFTTHVYNNYYDGNAKYGVGSALGGPSVFVENNYFRNCPYPMLISMQGSDVWDDSKNKNDYKDRPTFSKEEGGIIKAYGNLMEGVKRFIPYTATDDPSTAWDESVDFDAYVVENRNDKVPETVKTVLGVSGLKGNGGNTYNNFDTAPDFYEYTPDAAKDVPAIVMAGAGRVNGGDFKWEFDNAVEDSNHSVISGLKTAIVNYKSSVKAIGGGVVGEVTVIEDDSSNAPGGDDMDIDAPTATPGLGNLKKGETILLNAENGAEIYYTMTTDGSEPAEPTTANTKYENGITITAEAGSTVRIKAIAVVDGQSGEVASFTYTIVEDVTEIREPLSRPDVNPALVEGETYPVGVKISLTSKENGTIYYTLDGTEPRQEDGETPSETSKSLLENETISLDTAGMHIIKAFVVKEGYLPSETVTFAYAVSENATLTQLEQPAITPASKQVEKGEQITITITKVEGSPEDTEIYYTTDGTMPTNEKIRYTEPFKIIVNETMTIKAIAIKSGSISSTIASATYTVNESNQQEPEGIGLRVVLKNPKEVYTYTGSAIKPDIVVWNNSNKLVEGLDYTVKYSNNINASAGAKENKKPKITVTGKGNLAGNASTIFEIEKKKLNDQNEGAGVVEVGGVVNDSELGAVLLGVENSKLSPALYYGGAKLTNKDYDVSKADKCTKADEGKEISITGKGNFDGTLTYKLKVIGKNELKKFTVAFKAPNYTYNGLSQKFEPAEGDVKNADGSNLTKGTDYTIVYQKDTTNAGTVKFTVVGLGYYTGSVTKAYTIKPKTVTSGMEITGVSREPYPYIGTGVTIPTAGVTYTYRDADGNDAKIVLEEGKDYKLAYGNNKKIGDAKITVSFIGNYKGSKAVQGSFKIGANALTNMTEGVEIAVADMVYNKPGVYKSVPYVSVNGVEVKASEYTVTYYTDETLSNEMGSKNKISLSDDETCKKVYMKITGKDKGNYKGTELTTGFYRVYKKASESVYDLSKAKVVVYTDWSASAVKTNKMEYTGKKVEPGVQIVVKQGTTNRTLTPQEVEQLKKDQKLTVEYSNNVNKGKATIIINGDGETYVGGKTAAFNITTKNLKNTNVLDDLFKSLVSVSNVRTLLEKAQ